MSAEDFLVERDNKLAREIATGRFRQIVVVTGAGISTAAGIADYRSSSGFFSRMQAAFPVMKQPEDIFIRSFMQQHAVESHPIYQEHMRKIIECEPTDGHKFCTWLWAQGWLRRVYTQNIDGLHQKAGLPNEMVVEFHGSILQRNIVLYGESISKSVIEQTTEDFVINPIPIDLILILGTSLQVAPFCAIPNLVPKECVRVVIDLYPDRVRTNAWTKEKIDYEHFYDGMTGFSRSYTTFRKDRVKRQVTLRPQWGFRSKYQEQYLVTSDIDTYVCRIYSYILS